MYEDSEVFIILSCAYPEKGFFDLMRSYLTVLLINGAVQDR